MAERFANWQGFISRTYKDLSRARKSNQKMSKLPGETFLKREYMKGQKVNKTVNIDNLQGDANQTTQVSSHPS